AVRARPRVRGAGAVSGGRNAAAGGDPPHLRQALRRRPARGDGPQGRPGRSGRGDLAGGRAGRREPGQAHGTRPDAEGRPVRGPHGDPPGRDHAEGGAAVRPLPAAARPLPFFALAGALALTGPVGCNRPNDRCVQGYVEGEFVYVASPLAGALETLSVKRGAWVKVGDPLFVLE